jgi:hypothetical protein
MLKIVDNLLISYTTVNRIFIASLIQIQRKEYFKYKAFAKTKRI